MGSTTKVVPTTNNTQQQVQIPQYIQDAGQAAVAKAQDFASTPMNAFTGQMVAPLTGNQTAASRMAAGSQGLGQDNLNAAAGYLNQTGAALGQANSFAQGSVGAGLPNFVAANDDASAGSKLAALAGRSAVAGQDAGQSDLSTARGFNAGGAAPIGTNDIMGYFNPYVQKAIDPVIANLTRASGQNDAALRAKAAMTGSFGGSRATLQQTENQGNLLRQIATTTGQGYSDAYDKALGAAQADKARQAQAAGTAINIGGAANDYASSALGRLTSASQARLASSQNQSGLATTGSNLATAAQDRLLSTVNPGLALAQGEQGLAASKSQNIADTINRLLTTGALDQTQQQNLDNADYQQYQNQQNYALTQLNALIAAAGGVPFGTNTNSNTQGTQVVQSPSALGQIVGAVTAAASLAKSDRNAKENIKPADDEDILKKFRHMPVSTYQYKPEARAAIGDDGRTRVGPMAQDYAAQFGGTGKVIPMPEAIGHLTSAVRALEKRTRKAA